MPFSVNFVSGASARALIDDEAHYRHLASKMRAHGWLMGFGVGVLLPLGALASRSVECFSYHTEYKLLSGHKRLVR